MKKRGFFILTILAIFLISSIQANIYSEEGIYGTPLEEEVTGAITDTNATTECAGDEVLLGNGSCQSSADFGGAGANSSDYWDSMDTINVTQMEDNSGTLNILETWLDSLWCRLTGCSMTGNLNVAGNITTTEYFSGQPINGSVGSGIIQADDFKIKCGCVNASDEGGLNVKYPNMIVRIWDLDGTITYCNITGTTVAVPDNQHTVYYIDSTCAVQTDTWDNYFDFNLEPSNFARIFDVYARDSDIEVVKGASLIGLTDRKTKWQNVNCGTGGHLAVCEGIDVEENTFSDITQTAGHYNYVSTVHTSATKQASVNGIHQVGRVGGTWTHNNQTGLNLTHCDDGTDLIACSNNQYRRYIIYTIGFGVADTKIHQLAPLDNTSYTTLAGCLDVEPNPLSYTLPAGEDSVAVVHHFYCGKRDDTTWRDGWVDIRKDSRGFGALPDLSNWLSYDGLTKNWDAGNYNISMGQKITFFLGEIIDNIVDGWIRITGNLNVTGNLTTNMGLFTGDYNKSELLGYGNVRIGSYSGSTGWGTITLETFFGADNSLWTIDNGGAGIRIYETSPGADQYARFRINNTTIVLGEAYYGREIDLDITGDTLMRGNLNMSSHNITNVNDPINAQDVATKKYVDDNIPDVSAYAKIKVGTYTGDGSTGQAITGVGFQPKYVKIWIRATAGGADYVFEKADDSWGDYAYEVGTNTRYTSKINSLDADGFTVDDAGGNLHPNSNTVVYSYMALG